jgi:amino acid adenylation domain-containing protein
VPVDASAPARRSGSILVDCGVRAIVGTEEFCAGLSAALRYEHRARPLEALGGHGVELVLAEGPGGDNLSLREPGLAYVLYTSGSTGAPKGVMHTHDSALAFVDWCSEVFAPTSEDRFSSHAPLHFDLSILDLFVPLKHGAAVVLIDDELGKQPAPLARTIAEERITCWYSTPSILTLLLEYGKLEELAFPDLRLVLFAGEVFPIDKLRRLKDVWRGPRYANLYGPTETNVCTWFELPEQLPGDRTEPFPIGRPCSGDRARVVQAGADVAEGQPGELVIAGDSVMRGYWNDPRRTADACLFDGGERWYRTGDLVRADADGELVFLGRTDRMIKRRGYRIEPGEIEAALHRHPRVVEAAVLGVPGADGATTIVACLACRPDREAETAEGEPARVSLVELKGWCAERLPLYMVPDRFTYHHSLPKTSTDKVDYRALEAGL